MPSCVSAGIATSQGSIHFAIRSSPIRSQGCTSTGSRSPAQWRRKSRMPGSSRPFAPTWLPICTPTWPVAFARVASRQAASMSCSGTCASAFSRRGSAAQNAIARSFIRAHQAIARDVSQA